MFSGTQQLTDMCVCPFRHMCRVQIIKNPKKILTKTKKKKRNEGLGFPH